MSGHGGTRALKCIAGLHNNLADTYDEKLGEKAPIGL
jgi:hypothetical protein